MADSPGQYVYSENREIIQYLKQTRLFGHLPNDLLEKLVPLSEFASVPEKTTILQEGKSNNKVYFLMRGTVAVSSAGEPILKLQRAGDIFGEMSIISNQPCSATVISETNVDLFTIQAKDVGKFSDIDADVLQNMLYRIFATILTEKLRFTTFKAQQFEDTSHRLKRTQKQLQSAYNESLREISKRIEAEKALEAAKLKAEKANQAKSAFLANMSHEIRTPMHGVIGLTDLLSSSSLNKEQRHLTDVIKKSANALLAVIDDILDLTKIEIGGIQLQNSEVDIRNLVTEVLDLLKSKVSGKEIKLVSGIDANIPAVLKCDPVRLRQVLINLLENSIKFTKKGKVAVEVQLKDQTRESSTLLFTITDTGVGIPLDDQDNVFDEFYQGSASVAGSISGSGLGLPITKQLVELLGGEIQFESNSEKGSKFWFTIETENPFEVQKSQIFSNQSVKSGDEQVMTVEKKEPVRILIAEDDYINQQVILLSLKKLNYQSVVVTNGEAVIALLKKENFDLVFMDIQMPIIDGFETTQLIRNPETGVLNPDIPVIALTAHAIKGYREKCLAAGMNDHLSKPFQISTLDKVIRKWLPESLQQPDIIERLTNRKFSGATTAEAFDAIIYERLREETGQEFGNLVNMFLEELPIKTDLLKISLKNNALNDIRNTAHRLKSNSAIFGATALVSLCEELEQSDAVYIHENSERLTVQLLKNSQEIQEILQNIR